MRTIRPYVFETASSSVHSLVFSDVGLEPNRLPMSHDGYIEVSFGSFGKRNQTFWDQYSKLSYLITQCYYLGGWEKDMDNNHHFKNVEEAVCAYTGAKGIRIVDDFEPDIDHQMQPEYELNLVNEWDSDSIVNFVFNQYVGLHTDCD